LFIAAACSTNNRPDSKLVTDQPFWSDIQAFKKQDSISFPPKDAILLIGSSSFTKWTDVQDYFRDTLSLTGASVVLLVR
jgi:hypothetical protein